MADYDFETAAKKALGNAGKLPKPSVSPQAAMASAMKAQAAFKEGISDLEKHVLDLQDGYGHYKNSVTQYADLVEGATFGLDAKKPDDKKKIDTARTIMGKGLAELSTEVSGYLTMLSNLDKIITNLRKLENNRP